MRCSVSAGEIVGKLVRRTCLLLILFSAVTACANRDVVYRGMYESANQHQEMDDPGLVPASEDEPVSYEQYKRERQEELEKKN